MDPRSYFEKPASDKRLPTGKDQKLCKFPGGVSVLSPSPIELVVRTGQGVREYGSHVGC